jgi:uncharacterized protein YfaP (DUF2135 family)
MMPIQIAFRSGERIYFGIKVPAANGQAANLTGYSARADLRERPLPHPIPNPVPAALDNLTNTNGRIRLGDGTLVLSGVNVNVEVDIPGSVVAAWQFAKAYTDIKIVQPNGEVYRTYRFVFEAEGTVTP